MLIKRNILLFFRDRSNVFFSVLSVLIMLALYVLFLRNMMEDGLRMALGFDAPEISVVMGSITFAGIAAVISVTSSLGALRALVDDRGGASKDFLTSPVSSGRLTRSYMLASAVVSLIMTVIALILSVIFIYTRGGSLPDPADWVRLMLTIVLSVLAANSFMFFVTSLLKSSGAFATFSTLLGTLIGFLMGVYMPIAVMPTAVQWLIRLFPMTHAAAMFRQILADGALAELFANAPPEALGGFREAYGVVLVYGNFSAGFWGSALALAGSALLFYVLSLAMIKARRRP